MILLASPTHKRTEGRAPVWGYEFTSKDAALQGGVCEIAARLNEEVCDLRGGTWHLTAISPNPSSTQKLKADTEIKSRQIGVE
jgi:hypothetical protein